MRHLGLVRHKGGIHPPGDRRSLRERGATAVEYAGLTLLASMIIAGVLSTPAGKTMAAYTGTMVDKVLDTGDDVKTASDGINIADAAGAPTKQAALALAYAKSKVGVAPYVWGAKGPDAFDCSGLMYWAYGKAGVNIAGSSQTQWASTPHVPGGTSAKLLPGDLVFFHITSDAQGGINHVGMYAGNGMVVNASTSHAPLNQQIQFEPLSNFGSQYVGATRPTGGGTAQA